ncbi:MAG: response regulator [Spirochaetaceae bacterium]|jgi:signal transduction histidine kinase/CheY-like chemotaxis protein/HPt (histidine-containing phosphotransfer) domain-containing protein|nr:response regulator [Spirochaetaceae bacterium]
MEGFKIIPDATALKDGAPRGGFLNSAGKFVARIFAGTADSGQHEEVRAYRHRMRIKKTAFSLSALISFGLIFCYYSASFLHETINSILYIFLFLLTIVNVALHLANDNLVEALTKKAEAASKAKSDFLANMSHEIRTPMNAIIGLSEFMPVDNLDDTQKNYLRDIQKMSKNLLGIINDILDFSKIEAGKMEIIPVHFNLTSLFNDIVSMCGFIASSKALEFTASMDENLPDVVYGDELRIRQVFTNVINNAIKYTRTGFVKFRLKKEDYGDKEYIKAVVEDTGIGISKEDIQKLFGTFQRLNTNKNRRIPGTGLGLAITKQLLDLMDGSIMVESEYRQGSVFTIYIPFMPGDPLKIEKDADISGFVGARAGADIKILAVDDSIVNLTVIERHLAVHGMKADTCVNGHDAFNKILNKDYDLVFLDHMMPEMDGIETCRYIRLLDDEKYKKLPIVALSANAVSGARDLFLEAGMNDFISKPIDSVQLNSVLSKFLPPEKISKVFHAASVDGNGAGDELIWSDEERRIFRELSSIDGLNMQEMRTHTGSRTADYLKVLQQFINGVDENTEKIKTALRDRNWQDYLIQIHAYKGALAIIGMIELSARALTLETAARAIIESEKNPHTDTANDSKKNPEICETETPKLCDAITALRDALVKIPPLVRTRQAEKVKVNAVSLKEKLAAMEAACHSFKAKDAAEAAAQLEKCTFNEDVDAKIAKICELAGAFRFIDAVQEIKELDGLMHNYIVNSL